MQFTTLLATLALLAPSALSRPTAEPLSLSLAFSFPSADWSWWSSRDSSSQDPQLPASTLPPPTGVSLKYIALGVGTQNYTCAPGGVPVAIGALAKLYDAKAAFSDKRYGQAAIDQAPCYADKYNSAGPLRQIGEHYFNAAGQPTFDLWGFGALLQAKKTATANAPSGACTGRNGAAAVAWLQLQDNGAGVSHGVSEVYRVVTAGGSAPGSCDGMPPTFTSDYSAEYWLYL